MLRKSAVAGHFYPSDPEILLKDIKKYLGSEQTKETVKGIVVPHAGYRYSGYVAGAVFSRIVIPNRVLLLCPNHTGLGESLSIMSQGEWDIPLGRVRVDTELAEKLICQCPILKEDVEAHQFEHALEVQLPFLFFLHKDIQIVPIVMKTQGYRGCEQLGKAIAAVLRDNPEEDVLLVASSDMNHFEPDETTRIKDNKAIQKILNQDPLGLYKVVKQESISMCGYEPTIAMLYGVKESAQTARSELVKYATSGDIGGDRTEVVGYAGITIY